MDERYHLRELDETGKNWEAVLKPLLKAAPGRRVLDVGSGSGFLSILLGRLGYQVTGLDSSDWMVNESRGIAEYYGLSGQVEFCLGDAARMDLPGGGYDIVISRYASFLFTDPAGVYRECRRVLKPGGILLNFDMNWMAPVLDPRVGAAFRQDEARLAEEFGPIRDMYHNEAVLEQMKALPLAGVSRPDWDRDCLEQLGFSDISLARYPDAGLWNRRSGLRYRSIPTFSVRAVRQGSGI